MSAGGAGLQVRGLYKSYPTPGEWLVVLRGVSMDLNPGASAAVVGPSGSGKSTLLNILGTLDTPTDGTVRLGETDPFSLSAGELAAFRARRVGFVFQEHHLLPQCSAYENVLVPRLALGKVKEDDRRRAMMLLERVGLKDRMTHRPGELSGGERQRVAIARALMNQPSLILADEPTGNLDAATAQAVAALLLEAVKENNVMLVLVTHSMELAGRLDTRWTLRQGELVS